MPRFGDNEKGIIRQRLMSEGERLFTAFGLKKVSIDELVQAVGIAKGSFYSFYQSKEHLYMDIAGYLQSQMWSEMDAFLEEHRSLPPRELTRQCFLWMFSQSQKYQMLQQTDNETIDYLYRKLPSETIESHTKDDSQELLRLSKYGVTFKCDINIAAKTLQVIAVCFLNLRKNGETDYSAVMEIILDGAIKEIVNDECN